MDCMTLQHILGMLMFKDSSFRKVAKDPKGVLNALLIVFSVSLVVASLSYVLQQLVFAPLLHSWLPEAGIEFGFSPQQLLFSTGTTVVAALIILLIYPAIVRLFSTFLGANKGSYGELLAVFGHSYSVQLAGFIPFVGFAAWIYYVVMNIKGVSIVTGLSVGRSAAAYLLPLAILMGLAFFLVILLAVLAFSLY